MNWFLTQISRVQALAATAPLLTLLLVIDVVAYFGGLLYWYGFVMASPFTPTWAWPFIPDCPLFGLLSGLGLLIVIAHRHWSTAAQNRAQRAFWIVAIVSTVLWISTYFPGVPVGWARQGAMLGVWSWSLLLGAVVFRRAPAWFLAICAMGAIKYGIWTITAWLVFWRNTALVYGAPLFTFDSVFMTLTHIGLVGQGVLLLLYFRPTRLATIASFGWFILSDYVDYGLGFYPGLPLRFIPLGIMQWSTIAVTFALSGLYLWLHHNHMSHTVQEDEGLIQPIPSA
ncbi:MAG: DUF1405 domain-containing protein [Caldilineaceae bacterium]